MMLRPRRATVLLASAFLAVATPASAQGAKTSEAAIDRAIERGVAWLLGQQELDGSWDYGSGGPRAGPTALAVYTLVKAGVSPRHHAVQRALLSIEEYPPDQTYDVACTLLALTARNPTPHREWIERLTDTLLGWQKDGDWGYPSGADLSNTQFAALGLRAAAGAGIQIPARVWERLARATLAYQGRDGAFSYRVGDGTATGSMTTAGVGILALCLERRGTVEEEAQEEATATGLTARMVAGRDRGLDWLERHFAVNENPGRNGRIAYYLYGLERVGALTGLTHIGKHDWYARGAEYIVGRQDPPGHWGTTFSRGIPDTCFALLFLQRATRPVTGTQAVIRHPHYESFAPGKAVSLIATGDSPLSVWIGEWSAEVGAALAWPEQAGRGPHVTQVVYLVDGEPVRTVRGRAMEPADGERFAARLEFPAPGTYGVGAEVHVLGPPETIAAHEFPGRPQVFAIPAVEVTIEEVAPAWMLENVRDPRRNLAPGAGPRAQASSTLPGSSPEARRGHGADNAVDGRQSSSWVAAGDDPAPTLQLTFAAPPLANTLVLGHARLHPVSPGFFARAMEVRVTVNHHDRYTVRMNPDEERKTRFALPHAVRIRHLELELCFPVPGSQGRRATGLAEVELQLQD